MSGHLSSAQGTFRDPAGRLRTEEDRILREIYLQHVQSVLDWVRSPLAQRWMQQRRLVQTTILICSLSISFRPLRPLVTLPLLLEKSKSAGSRRPRVFEELSAFTIRRFLRSTRNLLFSMAPTSSPSRWSSYNQTASHYSSSDEAGMQAFVRGTLERIRPANVLDVRANTGSYSRIAAESGANVVAWDTDVQASDANWQMARRDGLAILPIVADFARPTPSVEWQNCENSSLLDRAKGRFDCVLMLGILHHLLVGDQIPLPAIIEQLWEISTRWVIAEWIPKEDSLFDELCRGRHELYFHLNEEIFVQTLSRRFAARDCNQLENGRSLWLLEAIA